MNNEPDDATETANVHDQKAKGDKPRGKKTRRHFREQAQRARAQPQVSGGDNNEPNLSDDAVDQPLPSEIIEMDPFEDEERPYSTSVPLRARYLVENEVSGDFYQVRTRQKTATFSGHTTRLKTQRIARGFGQDPTKESHGKWQTLLQRDGEKTLVVVVLGISKFKGGVANFELLQLRAVTALLATAFLVLLIGSPSALRLSRAHQTNDKWYDSNALCQPNRRN
ncbi:hypothetical protein BBJ28_00012721 [Nothophytophthora sp. Chile5]|nr:hypothetical protein BBJ28_00012721 [Nothophytophthora sp. Chile5]